MSKELWATYSVKDHLDPRALAIDVTLFDRLVFPVPETGSFPPNSNPTKVGPVNWTRDDAEWAEWVKEKWDPEAQQHTLDLLRPVIRKVSWTRGDATSEEFRTRAGKLAAQNVRDYMFAATRSYLTRDLPAHVHGISAIGPAYRTVAEMERDFGVASEGATRTLPGGALPTVLAWKFFAPDPEDERFSTDELLKETVAFVTEEKDFRKARTAFNDWQQRFLDNDTTDPESIKRAVAEMDELLRAARKAARRLAVRKTARYVFRLAPSALGLAAAFAGYPAGVELATGVVFLSVGGVAVDETLFKSADEKQPAPTAFVHDVRRHFGWKAKRG